MVLWGSKKIFVPTVNETNNPLVLLGQTRLLTSVNNLAGAKALLDKLKVINNHDPRVWNLYGVLAIKENRPDDAKILFAKAISLKEDYVPAIHNFGVATKSKADLDKATLLFEKYNHFAYFPSSTTLDY
jgi:Flp pilus assembly protein TadD